jgi:hypothetical protein
MVFRHQLVYILLIPFLAGCFSSVVKERPLTVSLSGSPTGKIVNRGLFIKDGTLAVLPFKAGEDAESDPQLDRMALTIAKGMIDYLNEQKAPFKVLTTQDQGNPQMIVEGYIEDLKRPGKLSRWVLRRNKTVLSVRGQMALVGSKDRVLMFQETKSMPDPKKDGLDIAYQTGQDLGRFILDALSDG